MQFIASHELKGHPVFVSGDLTDLGVFGIFDIVV